MLGQLLKMDRAQTRIIKTKLMRLKSLTHLHMNYLLNHIVHSSTSKTATKNLWLDREWAMYCCDGGAMPTREKLMRRAHIVPDHGHESVVYKSHFSSCAGLFVPRVSASNQT